MRSLFSLFFFFFLEERLGKLVGFAKYMPDTDFFVVGVIGQSELNTRVRIQKIL